MIEEKAMYETNSAAFRGMSKQINGSDCPASWKDVFVLNDECGRAHVIPSASVVLSEVRSSEWSLERYVTILGPFRKSLFWR